MKNNIKIKHIHAHVSIFNGYLYFIVKDRLFKVGLSTPNFNDYGEWRLDSFYLSTEPYNPETNTVELKPYPKFKTVSINEEDFLYMEAISKIHNDDDLTDVERAQIIEKHGEVIDCSNYRGGIIEGESKHGFTMIVWNDEKKDNLYIRMKDWRKLEDELKHPFEKIFFPIMESFRKGYLADKSKKIPDVYI